MPEKFDSRQSAAAVRQTGREAAGRAVQSRGQRKTGMARWNITARPGRRITALRRDDGGRAGLQEV